VSLDFQGASGALRTGKDCLLCWLSAASPAKLIPQTHAPSRRKENSSQNPRGRLQAPCRCRCPPRPFRNINRIPFRCPPVQVFQQLSGSLGSTHPGPTAVHPEPFPTSVFKVLIWIFATTTKICTIGRFRRNHLLSFFTTDAPSYYTCPTHWQVYRASEARFSAIHFQGYFIRQVSHNTLLSGCRLSWPPPCCLDELTPFMGSHERALWLLSAVFGSSRIASSAYQKWPTRHTHSSPRSVKNPVAPYQLKVWE